VWLIECTSLSNYYMDSFRETAPRKTAENTVKQRGGVVGSIVANHRGGGGHSLTVTRLVRVRIRVSIMFGVMVTVRIVSRVMVSVRVALIGLIRRIAIIL